MEVQFLVGVQFQHSNGFSIWIFKIYLISSYLCIITIFLKHYVNLDNNRVKFIFSFLCGETDISNQLQGAMQNMLKMTRFLFIHIKFDKHFFKKIYISYSLITLYQKQFEDVHGSIYYIYIVGCMWYVVFLTGYQWILLNISVLSECIAMYCVIKLILLKNVGAVKWTKALQR